jgi:DNA ligase-1
MLYSRNGKEFSNFPHIAEQVRALVQKHNLRYDLVLDGEIVGDSFQQLMKHAHRKDHVENTADYHVFDIMRLDELKEGHCNRNQHNRLQALDSLISMSGLPNIHLTDGFTIDLSDDHGHNMMTEYANKCVSQGYEGIMIKRLDAPYECKRSTFWMKWKPVITVDLEVVDLEEGTGRNEGRLGALVCEGIDDGRAIRVNVGSGLSDSDRDSFWSRRNELKGYIVEIKADAVTQNQDGTYSLRFPRFERFRGFEPGEKL